MNKKQCVLGILCFGMSLFSVAQQQTDSLKVEQLEEVVVTDSRFKLKRENSGKTVVRISAKELEQNQGKTITEIINTKSGITINGSQSNSGQNLSTFVRGGQNRQVLVLIDGIAVSDPSQIENNYDLQLLALDQIESVEILKGASSALYGNRASTAVINITLKKASNSKVSANFTSFMATNNSSEDSNIDIADFTNSVGFNGSLNKFNYLVNFSHRSTDGLSAIKAEEGTASNSSDRYSKFGGNIKLGYKFTDAFDVQLFANYDKYRTGFDESFGFTDADNLSNNKQYRIGIAPTFKYNKGSVTINAAINDNEREFESSFPSKFESQSIVVDAFNKYKFTNKLYTIVGVNYVKTEMDSYSIPFGGSDFEPSITSNVANDNIFDPYVNVTYLSGSGLNINAGARLNNHSEYGSHFVYNVNPSYVFKFADAKSLKVLSSYSTAYITPSLFQLFAAGFGNVDLQPQEDTTIEVGLAFDMNSKLSISTVYFNRDQDNFIDYVVTNPDTFEGEYQNVSDDFKVQGVEVEVSYQPTSKLNLDANYTFTERKDGVIFRVPKHKVNAVLGYQMSECTFASLSYQFNSERTSPFFNDDFTANRILESYSLVNFNVNHTIIKDRLKVFASVSNVFNEDYEELYRFTTLGRNFRLGFSLNF